MAAACVCVCVYVCVKYVRTSVYIHHARIRCLASQKKSEKKKCFKKKIVLQKIYIQIYLHVQIFFSYKMSCSTKKYKVSCWFCDDFLRR